MMINKKTTTGKTTMSGLKTKFDSASGVDCKLCIKYYKEYEINETSKEFYYFSSFLLLLLKIVLWVELKVISKRNV